MNYKNSFHTDVFANLTPSRAQNTLKTTRVHFRARGPRKLGGQRGISPARRLVVTAEGGGPELLPRLLNAEWLATSRAPPPRQVARQPAFRVGGLDPALGHLVGHFPHSPTAEDDFPHSSTAEGDGGYFCK